jgi:hypothetical protein
MAHAQIDADTSRLRGMKGAGEIKRKGGHAEKPFGVIRKRNRERMNNKNLSHVSLAGTFRSKGPWGKLTDPVLGIS